MGGGLWSCLQTREGWLALQMGFESASRGMGSGVQRMGALCRGSCICSPLPPCATTALGLQNDGNTERMPGLRVAVEGVLSGYGNMGHGP